MRSTLIITLFAILGLQQAQAATVTANVSARILEPVKVSLQIEQERFAKVRTVEEAVVIESFNDIHYNVSHSSRDVCPLTSAKPNAQLAQANCETYTVNFN